MPEHITNLLDPVFSGPNRPLLPWERKRVQKLGDAALGLLMEGRAWVEKSWCQGRLARTADGRVVGVLTREAASWCAVGALTQAASDGKYAHHTPAGEVAVMLLSAVVEVDHYGHYTRVAAWNDAKGRTQQEVLAAYDDAIALGLQIVEGDDV
jgi:hypothetical protein